VDDLALLRLLNASAGVVAGLLLGFVLVYGRVSALSRPRPPLLPPRPLTEPELEGLRRWQRRTLSWFLTTMGGVVAFSACSALARWLPLWAYPGMYLATVSLAAVALAVHFSARCPACGRRIGFQSTLVLPLACEICGAVFRPESAWLALPGSRRDRSVHVVSDLRILGWPLYAVEIGGDPATGRTRGVARGIIAVGDVAVGLVAVGGVAVGVLPVGGISIGVLSVGGVAIGFAALGGLAVGGLALGGVALAPYAMGGIAL